VDQALQGRLPDLVALDSVMVDELSPIKRASTLILTSLHITLCIALPLPSHSVLQLYLLEITFQLHLVKSRTLRKSEVSGLMRNTL
jgi:hypothetical protein